MAEAVQAADGSVIYAVTPESLKHYHDTQVTADKIPYDETSSIKAVLEELKDKVEYVPVAVKSFTNNVGTVENGQTITDVTLAWTLDGKPTEVKLGDEAQPLDLNGSKVLTNQAITKNTSWTLSVKDAKEKTASATTSLFFKDKKYYGAAAAPETIDSAFILGLAGKDFGDNLKGDYTLTAGDGEYFFFAMPASWAEPAFWMGGFEGGMNLVKTLDFTNASGAVVSYKVYQSTHPNLGTVAITVK